ncbi:MAG: GNAT family N-acetyltransferase [Bacillota bacterium]
MELESGRLLLRRYRDEDFEFLYSLLKQPEVMRHIGDGKVKSRQQALEFLYWIYRMYREHPKHGLFLLVRKDDGKRIGHAGLVPQSVDGQTELEVGYWLAPEFWGCGYAREAAALLCQEGFMKHGQTALISLIQPENHASRKVAEAIGMEYSGKTFRNEQAVLVYQMEKERWHAVSRT